MSLQLIATAGVVAVIVAAVFGIIYAKLPKKLKTDKFIDDWRQLQVFCKDKKTWPHALINADKLLDNALKKRKFKGKTMGERMVSAQRQFTDNDAIWFAHNLRKKMTLASSKRLKEEDVKAALLGFRQGLKDLGALPNEK